MRNRVFLSSTFADLREHREAAQKAIRQLGAVDVSMEHFGAREQRATHECKRLIQRESDLFVGVYAHRYGYVPDGGNTSISEIEYEAAGMAGLPRFIYVIDPQHPWLPDFIDAGEPAVRLKALKERLFANHICQSFRGADQLAMNIAADLGRHLAMERATPVRHDIPAYDIGFESAAKPVDKDLPDDWSRRRDQIYDGARGVFLAHIIRPSARPGQQFDVFIYLVRHKSTDFSDVQGAEFFLGRYWGNQIFSVKEQDGFIGISTAAYGTFLCVCRVTFTDGTDTFMSRYIDFEMGLHGGARKDS